jgi:hypothetical protein
MREMNLSALGDGAQGNERNSVWLNKKSSQNALNENKRIMRMCGMKLSAFDSIS